MDGRVGIYVHTDTTISLSRSVICPGQVDWAGAGAARPGGGGGPQITSAHGIDQRRRPSRPTAIQLHYDHRSELEPSRGGTTDDAHPRHGPVLGLISPGRRPGPLPDVSPADGLSRSDGLTPSSLSHRSGLSRCGLSYRSGLARFVPVWSTGLVCPEPHQPGSHQAELHQPRPTHVSRDRRSRSGL